MRTSFGLSASSGKAEPVFFTDGISGSSLDRAESFPMASTGRPGCSPLFKRRLGELFGEVSSVGHT